jgi:DNA ligase D-like protein (predicted polymerase)
MAVDLPPEISFTSLDDELFRGAGATKRELVDYLDAVADRIVPALADRALSVIRVHRGQAPFMQKNLPKHAPEWIRTVHLWAETSQRDVAYAVCDDRRTLLWFANQRAVEYHPSLCTGADPEHMTHLVIDLDPVEGMPFGRVVDVARMVGSVLADVGLSGVPKTSGAKGLHVFVPIAPVDMDLAAGALRAIAARVERLDPSVATTAFMKEDRGGRVFVDATRVGGSTVVSVYSPRLRPGVPVSFPLSWDALDDVVPAELTIARVPALLGGRDPWAEAMPAPQVLPSVLVEEGRAIPVARVAAMHEGKRRKRAKAAEG